MEDVEDESNLKLCHEASQKTVALYMYRLPNNILNKLKDLYICIILHHFIHHLPYSIYHSSYKSWNINSSMEDRASSSNCTLYTFIVLSFVSFKLYMNLDS